MSVVCRWRFRDEDAILEWFPEYSPKFCIVRRKMLGENTATVPLTWVSPSFVPRFRNVMSSSAVALEKASTRWGVKKAICVGEKTGDGFESEIKSSWRRPFSWVWVIPCNICLMSDSLRTWGCWGGTLNSLKVCRVIFPTSLWWMGVLTSGVHVHWTASNNVTMVPQNFRKKCCGALNFAVLKRTKGPVVFLCSRWMAGTC